MIQKLNLQKIIIISLVILICGCSNLTVRNFDNNEYLIVSQIRTDTEKCILSNQQDNIQLTKTLINQIWYNSLLFKNYTEYTPNNINTYNMAKDLSIITSELQEHKYSKKYTDLKLHIVQDSIIIIQKGIGDKRQ